MPLISWLLAAKRRYRTAQGERSGTLGNSYQLGSALEERQKLPAKKRASFVVPFCSSFRAGRFILYNYPGFRCASPWAEIFNRFAVGPTGSERSCWSKMPLSNRYQNENIIRVFCYISSQRHTWRDTCNSRHDKKCAGIGKMREETGYRPP